MWGVRVWVCGSSDAAQSLVVDAWEGGGYHVLYVDEYCDSNREDDEMSNESNFRNF